MEAREGLTFVLSKISLRPTPEPCSSECVLYTSSITTAREFVKNADLEQHPDVGNQELHLNSIAARFLGTFKFENISPRV